jgi:hypothetical protein
MPLAVQVMRAASTDSGRRRSEQCSSVRPTGCSSRDCPVGSRAKVLQGAATEFAGWRLGESRTACDPPGAAPVAGSLASCRSVGIRCREIGTVFLRLRTSGDNLAESRVTDKDAGHLRQLWLDLARLCRHGRLPAQLSRKRAGFQSAAPGFLLADLPEQQAMAKMSQLSKKFT